eukprot:6173871-Pleurochrysis_carterae.AAC.1
MYNTFASSTPKEQGSSLLPSMKTTDSYRKREFDTGRENLTHGKANTIFEPSGRKRATLPTIKEKRGQHLRAFRGKAEGEHLKECSFGHVGA